MELLKVTILNGFIGTIGASTALYIFYFTKERFF